MMDPLLINNMDAFEEQGESSTPSKRLEKLMLLLREEQATFQDPSVIRTVEQSANVKLSDSRFSSQPQKRNDKSKRLLY